jgi:hypothetical protein
VADVRKQAKEAKQKAAQAKKEPAPPQVAKGD